MKEFGGMAHGSKSPKGGRLGDRDAQSLPIISTVVLGMHDGQELTMNINQARRYKPLAKDELGDTVGPPQETGVEIG